MKKILSLFLIIISLFTIFAFTSNVNAATKYGYGFSSEPIRIYSGSQLNSSQVNVLKQAISRWNSTRKGTLLTYGGIKNVFNPTLADGWNTATVGNLGTGVGGQTYTYTNGSNIV